MPDIYVDADGCPVKEDVYRIAVRYGLKVYVVANTPMRASGPNIESVVVRGGLNAADDWIADRISAGDIAITNDIPLADRCLQKGASALGATGRRFCERTIGSALATRELLAGLRQTGAVAGGPPPFQARDRSRFLAALHELIGAAMRAEARRSAGGESSQKRPERG